MKGLSPDLAVAEDQDRVGRSHPMTEAGHGQGLGDPSAADWGRRSHDAVMRIPVSVKIILGSTRMQVSQVMALTRGSIVALDRKVGDMVDIVVNDRLVARGEVVILDEEADRFAVALSELVPGRDG